MRKWKITNKSIYPVTLHITMTKSIPFEAGESIVTTDKEVYNMAKQCYSAFIVEELQDS